MTRSILEGPAVWKGDGLSQSPDWKWDFANTDPRAIREALESGPGALMLHGFPIDQYDRDEAREALGRRLLGRQTHEGRPPNHLEKR